MQTELGNVIHELLRCRTLQDLLNTAQRFLGNPLILADMACHVLAITSGNDISDPRWLQIERDRIVEKNIINIEQYQSSLRSEMPVMTTDSTDLTVVRYAVSQDQRMIGFLLMPCYKTVPTQLHLDLIRVLGDVCGLRMQKDLHYGEYPENMLEFFISNLLNGTITDEQQILDRCRHFQWHVKAPFRVMTIQSRQRSAVEDGSDYLKLSRFRDSLQRQFPDATAFLYGNQVKMIIPVYDQTTRDAIVMKEVERILTQENYVAGVSQTAKHVRSLYRRNQQSAKALELAGILRATGPLFYYDTYSVYHCLELCAPHIELPKLCHYAVLKLERYDRENGTELLGTLHAYLSCHRNLSEAAASLYVHRNTLSKRLEKINDLVHVDFDDAETVFHLMFSYRIIEYYGATVLRTSFENWNERAPILRHP